MFTVQSFVINKEDGLWFETQVYDDIALFDAYVFGFTFCVNVEDDIWFNLLMPSKFNMDFLE